MALLTGLQSAYELNEASGNAVDALGVSNATLNGSSGAATGKLSGCRTLSGSPNYFESTKVIASFPISMSVWARTSNTSASLRDPFVLGHSSSANQYFGFQMGTDHKPNWIAFGLALAGPSAVNDGNWHLWTGISRSATNHQLYIDGASVATSSTNIGAFPGLNRQTLGALNYGGTMIQYWIGDLDQCLLWNVDITSDLAALWNSGNGSAYPFSGGSKALLQQMQQYSLTGGAL